MACLYSCDMGPCVVDKASAPLRRGAVLTPPGPRHPHQLKNLDTVASYVWSLPCLPHHLLHVSTKHSSLNVRAQKHTLFSEQHNILTSSANISSDTHFDRRTWLMPNSRKGRRLFGLNFWTLEIKKIRRLSCLALHFSCHRRRPRAMASSMHRGVFNWT